MNKGTELEKEIRPEQEDGKSGNLALLIQSEKKIKERITWPRAYGSVIQLSASAVLSRIVASLRNYLGNGVFLAQLSPQAFEAGGLVNSLQMALISTKFGALFSTAHLCGEAEGEKNYEKVGIVYRQELVFATLLSIPGTVVFLFSEPLMRLLGQNPVLAAEVGEYFKGMVWCGGVPFTLWLAVNQQMALGTHRGSVWLWTTLLQTVLALGAGYVLTLGWEPLHIPQLGMRGWGYASGAASALTFLVSTTFFALNRKTYGQYALFNWRSIKNKATVKLMLKMALPMAANSGGEVIANLVTMVLVGLLGNNALTSQHIVSQYSLMLIIPLYAIGHGCGTTVSKAFGGQRYGDIPRLGIAGISLGLGVGVMACILFSSIPRYLAAPFIDIRDPNNQAVIEQTRILMIVTGLGLIPDAVRYVAGGALRGYRDTTTSMAVSIGCMIVLALPLEYVLGFTAGLGVEGVNIARALTMLLGGAIVLTRWGFQTKNFHDISKPRDESTKKESCCYWPRFSLWSAKKKEKYLSLENDDMSIPDYKKLATDNVNSDYDDSETNKKPANQKPDKVSKRSCGIM